MFAVVSRVFLVALAVVGLTAFAFRLRRYLDRRGRRASREMKRALNAKKRKGRSRSEKGDEDEGSGGLPVVASVDHADGTLDVPTLCEARNASVEVAGYYGRGEEEVDGEEDVMGKSRRIFKSLSNLQAIMIRRGEASAVDGMDDKDASTESDEDGSDGPRAAAGYQPPRDPLDANASQSVEMERQASDITETAAPSGEVPPLTKALTDSENLEVLDEGCIRMPSGKIYYCNDDDYALDSRNVQGTLTSSHALTDIGLESMVAKMAVSDPTCGGQPGEADGVASSIPERGSGEAEASDQALGSSQSESAEEPVDDGNDPTIVRNQLC